jgi:hypothetical protein
VTEYKHQQVGIGFPVYCTDRDASAVRMLMRAVRVGKMRMFADKNTMLHLMCGDSILHHIRRPQYATDPAELRWMADIAAGDDVWGA